MKRKYIVLLMLLFVPVLFNSCNRIKPDLLKKMAEMEGSGTTSDSAIEQNKSYRKLKTEIAKYKKILDQKIDAADKLGTYYKLIGLKYVDYGMYGLALDSFKQALAIYPENSNVLYYAGMCSARLYKTEGSKDKSVDYLDQAQRYYKASISVNNRYTPSMYGLAVLYVYELQEPELAVPLLELYNKIQKSSTDGRFLLAAAYYGEGKDDDAVQVYNDIIGMTDDPKEKEAARSHRDEILRGGAGG